VLPDYTQMFPEGIFESDSMEINMTKEPKVTLVTHTRDPLETVYAVWKASKDEEPLMTTQAVKLTVPDGKVRDLFRRVIAQRIPVGEHVDFVFMVENISVSWREQAVRHRIGVKPSPERVGADIVMMDRIPDLAESSWWSQSMRLMDMGKFAQNGAFRLPATVERDSKLTQMFIETMFTIQRTYNVLVEAGIPMEDARELMPLGAQHRISWKLNIGALQHIVSKRGCFILQLGIWGPVIQGVITELVQKVDPVFSELVTPPCLDGNTFKGCAFHEECRRRISGEDALPPCPLHFRHHHIPEKMGNGDDIAHAHTPEVQDKYHLPMAEEMRARAEDYMRFWYRDPYTGERLGTSNVAMRLM